MAERKPLTSYAKAAAYMGLAFVTPISGWICYKIGQFLDGKWGTSWVSIAGLIIGCAAGMYETYRQGLSIEGLDALLPKSRKPKPPEDDGPTPE